MSSVELGEDVLEQLRALDTPTVWQTRWRSLRPSAGPTGFTTEPLVCAVPELPAMVGYARTVTIRAKELSDRSRSDAGQTQMAYYEYVSSGPRPGICVIQDLDDGHAGFGAFWGEVHTHVHRGLGCAGVVTNGSIRDLDDLAEGFQLLAGRIGPSHAYVHVVDFGVQVSVRQNVRILRGPHSCGPPRGGHDSPRGCKGDPCRCSARSAAGGRHHRGIETLRF